MIFEYPSGLWEGSVPIEYRRTGTYARNEEEEINILNKTYDLLNPENYRKWLENEETFWSENKKKLQSLSLMRQKMENGNAQDVNCQ